MTRNEQLLLNLVRLRYRDTPSFLELSNLATQFSFDESVGLAGTIKASSKEFNVLGLSAGVDASDRLLLGKLCSCAWTCLKAEAARLLAREDVVPGMIAAIQTHGELLHWHPHIHVLMVTRVVVLILEPFIYHLIQCDQDDVTTEGVSE